MILNKSINKDFCEKVENTRRSERYDYFLIWGHGLKHTDEIISTLRSCNNIEILKIIKHDVDDIVAFIDTVYSHDYAPIEHLRGKTAYLLNTPPQALFIFVLNKRAEEVMVGEGEYRHIECLSIKSIKKEIRNLYNPRINGKCSENHIIHSSDNEFQTDIMLRYLGYEQGIGLFELPNSLLRAPYHLQRFKKFELCQISTNNLKCSILFRKEDGLIVKNEVVIEETPQYQFLLGNKGAYIDYLNNFYGTYLTDDHLIDAYIKLQAEFVYTEGVYATNYIVVKKSENGGYVVLDGVHRASLLKKNNITNIIVAILNDE